MTDQQLFYFVMSVLLVMFVCIIVWRMWEKQGKTLARLEIRLQQLEALTPILERAEKAYANSYYTDMLVTHVRKVEAIKAKIAMIKGDCL